MGEKINFLKTKKMDFMERITKIPKGRIVP